MTTTTAHRRTAGRTTEREKALLFCPTCGYESRVTDGDWLVTERRTDDHDALVYECPDCFNVVVAHPILHD